MYKCPMCNVIKSAKEWNNATIEVYKLLSPLKMSIGYIEEEKNECDYVCPSCKHRIDGRDIKEVEWWHINGVIYLIVGVMMLKI